MEVHCFPPKVRWADIKDEREFEEALRRYVSYNHANWDEHVQMAAFAIHNSFQSSARTTPFMLYLGRHSRFPTASAEVTDTQEQRYGPNQHKY